MGRTKAFWALAITAAVWVTVAHGGDFNACRVTYDYDDTLLINGERFFPVGTYFLPPGYPENQGIPTIAEAYQAYAAEGGNILLAPRYYNMTGGSDDYEVHGLPSDLYYDEAKCVDHLSTANQYDVKLMTCPHIYWWWDADWRPQNQEDPYPGPHPIWIELGDTWGWHIEQPTQEERFSGLGPSGGIKGWVEAGASEAFLGWHHIQEATWGYWGERWDVEREYPQPPEATPNPQGMFDTYSWLRALEEDPAVDAEHPSFFFDPPVARLRDLMPAFYDTIEVVGMNTIPVPEPYKLRGWDTETDSRDWLPNYHAACGGDAMDVVFEAVNAEKPVICSPQNHDGIIYIGGVKTWIAPTAAQSRFMTYDGVIHRANGIIYGMQSFGSLEEDYWNIFNQLWDPCKPTFNEIGQGGPMHDVLKAEYDNLLVEVITRPQGGGDAVESSAFVGGELAPKNHFLSDRIIMEGCAKKLGEFSYLIVACREGIDQFVQPEVVYSVQFRPYFSSKTPWTGTVEVVGEPDPFGPGPRTINIVDGAFTDEFVPEAVHIYKFERPSPYAAE